MLSMRYRDGIHASAYSSMAVPNMRHIPRSRSECSTKHLDLHYRRDYGKSRRWSPCKTCSSGRDCESGSPAARCRVVHEDVLGFELALDQGSCRIYRITAGGYLGFCRQINIRQEHTNVIFTLVTQRVDDWYEQLKNCVVHIECPPKENPKYKIYQFFLRDPNGYLIEIQKFLDPRWGKT